MEPADSLTGMTSFRATTSPKGARITAHQRFTPRLRTRALRRFRETCPRNDGFLMAFTLLDVV